MNVLTLANNINICIGTIRKKDCYCGLTADAKYEWIPTPTKALLDEARERLLVRSNLYDASNDY